ncbi:MAG: CHC2 zinc finger domain-containing protein [Bacteroidota bacterium]
MITRNCINDITKAARIEDVVGEFVVLKGSGSNIKGDCPFCNKKEGLSVTKAKNIAKCFSCFGSTDKALTPVSFVMKIKTNGDYHNAIKYLAEKFKIELEYQQLEIPSKGKSIQKPKPQAPKPPAEKKAVKKNTFRDEQLIASGLTEDDQKYIRQTESSDMTIEMDRYQAGTKNEKWEIVPGDSDMVMHYMDLEGRPMMYHRKGTSKDYPLIRIRWANPGVHPDQNGKPMKYQSPYGSGSRLWINQTLRNKYKSRTKIETLFIQEGEKKADKATKHGITSVGIMGIHNIANNKELPHEFELIIKRCDVKNVVFIVDSDYLDIGESITSPIDQRPRSFLSAIINFRKYFYALNKSGINLNIFFGYIKADHKQKGIDDLLVNTLPGKEDLLLKDIKSAMFDEKGAGEYINCHNITSHNEFKLKAEFFHMETNETFAKFHADKLKDRPTFNIGRESFKFSTKQEFPDLKEGTLVLAQPLSHEEEFWQEQKKKKGEEWDLITTFKYVECCSFLENRSFGRYAVNEEGEFNFIKVDDNVVRVVKQTQIKDYLMEFTREALQKKNVLEMLYKGAKMYLSDNLNNLRYIKLNFHKSDKGLQYMYFDKVFWKITSEGIEEKPILELNGHVWRDKIKNFKPSLKTPMVKVERDANRKYKLVFPAGYEEAKKCDFFNYLMNTSNFYWRKTHEGLFREMKKPTTPYQAPNDLESEDMTLHFISKCVAFGYMLHEYFDANRAKAVVGMDGKLSEVGASNGRSGKSLFGVALSKLVPTVTLPGKQKDLTEDKFLLDGVTERTRIVNIDDVRVNFDFEAFFSNIGGAWKINPKGAKAFELQRESSPKILITTNHALNGEGGSFRDRQFLIAFSDFYNEDYRPVDEHGVLFFDEWDVDQWNRFYNFAAVCLQIFFEHGLVTPPMERLEKRRMRQQMGEAFIEWADNFFDEEFESQEDGKNNLNRALERTATTESFYVMFPEQRKYYDKRKVKHSLQRYCQYKDFIFNPGKEKDGKKYGGDDRRGGKEYFTIEPKMKTNFTK